MTGAVEGPRGAPAVVRDLELERARAEPDGDFGGRRTGVLDDVRERFLHDPICGEVDAGREMHGLALDAQLDRQARGAHLIDERRERIEPGLRPDRELLVVGAEDPEEAA